MSGESLIACTAAAGTLVYLMYTLLRPDKF